MIQKYSRLRVADNSGARTLSCISVIGRSTSDTAEVGDVIVASVKQALPNSGVKKGDVVRAVADADGRDHRPPGADPHQQRAGRLPALQPADASGPWPSGGRARPQHARLQALRRADRG